MFKILLASAGVAISLPNSQAIILAFSTKSTFDLASIPFERYIVGETLLSVESGIVTSWVRRCRDENPLELGPFIPSLVGQRPVELVLGKSSGIDSVAEWLEKIGGDASQEQREAIVLKVKDASIKKKGLLTEQEFKKIVDSVVHG